MTSSGRRDLRVPGGGPKALGGGVRGAVGRHGCEWSGCSGLCACACRALSLRPLLLPPSARRRALAPGGGGNRGGGPGRAGRGRWGRRAGQGGRARRWDPRRRRPRAGDSCPSRRGSGASGRGPMEDLSLDSCGGEDAAPGAKGWPAPQARVHFRVTRFIMEAGNRGREESQSRAGGT